MYIGTKLGVARAAAIKRKTETKRFVWEELNEVVGTPWKLMPGAPHDGEEAPVARNHIAGAGDELPLQVGPPAAGGHGGVLGPRRVFIRASVVIEKHGTTLLCPVRGYRGRRASDVLQRSLP